MKIAITGHSAGIGMALATIYESLGHEIVGLSRRNGYNIRSVPKLIPLIESCDVFINNAQVGFAQTELLFSVYKLWEGIPGKKIINISTIMASMPTCLTPGLDMLTYRVQKVALEEAHKQLAHLQNWPKLILIRPGAVATQPGQLSPRPCADVTTWAEEVYKILHLSPDIEVTEFSIGVNYP